MLLDFFLLDFSSFVSDPADGKNCMTSSCTNTGHVNFVKVYCNITDSGVRGVCGKYCYIVCLIDCIHT